MQHLHLFIKDEMKSSGLILIYLITGSAAARRNRPDDIEKGLMDTICAQWMYTYKAYSLPVTDYLGST